MAFEIWTVESADRWSVSSSMTRWRNEKLPNFLQKVTKTNPTAVVTKML